MCLKGDIVEMLEKYMCNLLVTFLAVKNNAVKKKKIMRSIRECLLWEAANALGDLILHMAETERTCFLN